MLPYNLSPHPEISARKHSFPWDSSCPVPISASHTVHHAEVDVPFLHRPGRHAHCLQCLAMPEMHVLHLAHLGPAGSKLPNSLMSTSYCYKDNGHV